MESTYVSKLFSQLITVLSGWLTKKCVMQNWENIELPKCSTLVGKHRQTSKPIPILAKNF